MLDWDFVFAQLKRFYRCSKAEFKKMTLYEVFQLLEDGGELAKMESGEKKQTTETQEGKIKRLRDMAKRRKATLIREGKWKS